MENFTISHSYSNYYFSSTFLVSTALKASTNQMYALQYFSLEEFLQNLLRVQSLFQAAPQAILQLLILLETLDELSTIKGKQLYCLYVHVQCVHDKNLLYD